MQRGEMRFLKKNHEIPYFWIPHVLDLLQDSIFSLFSLLEKVSYEKVVGFREVDFGVFLCWRVGVWIEVRFLSCFEYYNLCIFFCPNSNFGIISWCFLLWGCELSKFIITYSSVIKLSFCTWSVHVQGFSCKIPLRRWKIENLSLIAVLFSFVLVGCLKGKWSCYLCTVEWKFS